MAPNSAISLPQTCPYCGFRARSGGQLANCPACDAPWAGPEQGSSTSWQESRIQEKLVDLNEQLIEAGGRNAEDAFSLGCWMGIFVVLLAGGLTYLLSGGNWILVIIVLITATLALSGLVMLLSLQAKAGAMRRAYQSRVAPSLEDLQAIYHLDDGQFAGLVDQILPEGAPLREHITLPLTHTSRSDNP